MKIISNIFLFLIMMTNFLMGSEANEESKKPRVSIITSIYNGDEFIEGFLADITKQTIFNECELILINANSPGNEEKFIKPYLEKHPNMVYIKLDKDPGVYGVWNLGIKRAKADFITNANIDDRRNPECLEMHAKALEEDPTVDLVFSDYRITTKPNETFEVNTSSVYCQNRDFSPTNMFRCLPGPQPMWRKSMHDHCGYFSEQFVSSGDHEMWNRAVSKGSKFKKVPGFCGLYYENPKGLSTKADSKKREEDQFVLGAYYGMWSNLDHVPPKLLIHLSSRSHPEQFFESLNQYYRNLSGIVAYHFLISLDENDVSMNSPEIIEKLNTYPYLSYYFGKYESPVAFHNRDIEKYPNFDILLVGRDDIVTISRGYDKAIVEMMKKSFPNYDGLLTVKSSLSSHKNTIPVMGKKYYDRFGYVYHPDYQYSFYDEELRTVGKILRKIRGSSDIFLVMNQPNQIQLLSPNDRELFFKRREAGFDLKPEWIEESTPKLWSILICTLDERETSFQKLYHKLLHQIQSNHLTNEVEVLYCKDNRENTVGFKRNALVYQSEGKYISFIDDDDDIHDNYVSMIAEKLRNNPDCVSLTGIITTNGENPKKFIHSLAIKTYFETDGIYYRPPNHLNPMKRAVAVQFSFPETNYGEDTNWAMQVAHSGLLKQEEFINEPYYFYLWDTTK